MGFLSFLLYLVKTSLPFVFIVHVHLFLLISWASSGCGRNMLVCRPIRRFHEVN
jgi:hypothetical protein